MKKLSFIKSLIPIYKFAFPTDLPFVPLALVVAFSRLHWKTNFPDTMRLQFSCVQGTLVPSTIAISYISFFGIEIFDFYVSDVLVLFEIDCCVL